MNPDEWEELVAQVKSHGVDKIVFYALDETNRIEPDWVTLDVQDIRFEDDKIKVVMI